MAENNRITGSEEPKIEAGAEDELPAEVPPAPSAGNEASPPEMKNVQDLTRFVELLLQQMQDRFQSISDQVLSRIDEMSNRIDDLERNIADLVTQSGVEGAGK